MTDHCYVAVKGSLHSTDCSVFGLNTEEIFALSKRFSDSVKEVVNGILIKGNPIVVINCLGEIGYRVVCSSGETEIVWTLRREVLACEIPSDEDAIVRTVTSKPPVYSPSKKYEFSEPQTRGKAAELNDEDEQVDEIKPEKKKPPRLGTKPEDLAEYGAKGSVINIRDPESFEEAPPPPDKRIILNTNLSSEGNPLSAKNIDPQEKMEFITTYSETIAQPLDCKRMSGGVGGTCSGKVCTPGSRPHSPQRNFKKFPAGPNKEVVLAEYTAQSVISATNIVPIIEHPNTPQSSNSPKNPNIGMNRGRNLSNGSPSNSKNRYSPYSSPMQQRRKTAERIGTKPEDIMEFNKNQKIEVLDFTRFYELPEEQALERNIIVKTNRSSEGNPFSFKRKPKLPDSNSRPFSGSRRP